MPESPNSTAKIVSVRFEDPALVDRIDAHAQQENRTRSNMIVQMITQWLETFSGRGKQK